LIASFNRRGYNARSELVEGERDLKHYTESEGGGTKKQPAASHPNR